MRISNRRKEMGEKKWAEYQKQRRNKKVTDWRKRKKWQLITYKGRECKICGYNKKIPGAYDFHHRDATEKEFGIAKNGRCRGIEKLKKEVDKCDLLCCRCHQELHYEQDYSQ